VAEPIACQRELRRRTVSAGAGVQPSPIYRSLHKTDRAIERRAQKRPPCRWPVLGAVNPWWAGGVIAIQVRADVSNTQGQC